MLPLVLAVFYNNYCFLFLCVAFLIQEIIIIIIILYGFNTYLCVRLVIYETKTVQMTVGYWSLSTTFLHQTTIIAHTAEKLLFYYKEVWQNVKLLLWVETDHVFPVDRGRVNVKYSSSFACSVQRNSTCSQQCVQLCTERQMWQRNWSVSVIVTPLSNCSVKPTTIL